MPWEYSQRTGQINWNGRLLAAGYSGMGIGRNNPQMERVRDVGPIPRGRYRIGPSHAHPGKGPVTMSLSPVGHAAYGRTAFLIHGDSSQHPGAASHGCIVLPQDARRRIAASGDMTLEVVE